MKAIRQRVNPQPATTQAMREAMREWLQQERATPTQCLQLLEALYGGVIDGRDYQGSRPAYWEDPVVREQIDEIRKDDRRLSGSEERYGTCGCLLSELETSIRSTHPKAAIRGPRLRLFVLAFKICYGDTPATSAWCRAAVQGIEDYLTGIEAHGAQHKRDAGRI
jgi:hypothetical protein